MLKLNGINNESLVLDGEWLEKLRGNQSVARTPAAEFQGMETRDLSRRRKLFGGEREELIQLTIRMCAFIGLTVPAERRAEVERLRNELEAQAGRPSPA